MAYATAEELLAAAAESRKNSEDDVELLGLTVRVRGLTAAEDARVSAASIEMKSGQRRGSTKFRPDEKQRLTVKYGLLNPKLNDSEITRFLTTVGAEDCDKIVDRINELSGDGDEADEAREEAFPEPDA